MSENYGAKDIITLSQGESYRKRIGMYLSGDLQEAVNLGLRELIVNVQDEYEVYKPKNPYIKIILDTKKKVISCEDNMRGIPVGIRPDGTNSLTAAFLINHSGGKMSEGAYTSSVGLNGVGNKVVCHTAKWLEVYVKRDGILWYQRFESDNQGAHPVTEVLNKGKYTGSTGTKIVYQPDDEVYKGNFIQAEQLRALLREMSYFTKGLKISLTIDGKEEIFLSEHGLIDAIQNKNIIGKPFSYNYEAEDCKVELALAWVTNGGDIKGYANGLYMREGGNFITSFKTSLTRTFNNVANTKFTGEQIRGVLMAYVSVKVHEGQFSNQAKTALANKEAATATSTAISEAVKKFAAANSNDFKKVVDILSKYEKAEKAAERTRQAILNAEKEQVENQKKKIVNADKLRDARKLGQDSVLLVAEGLSAGGSMSIGRDPQKYGILMLRGKLINLLSNTIEDGLENEEVKLLQQALGIIYNRAYNPKKLRYGRVAIATDADSDGSHIGLLIMAALHVLCPKFLEENRLCWLRAPIYKVSTKKKNYYYYTEEEFVGHPAGDIVKYKGLGQMSDQDLKESMFNPEWQRLEPITYSAEGVEVLIELMGSDVKPRKEFVFNNIDFSEFHIG